MVLQKIITQSDVYYFNNPREIYTDWLYDTNKVDLLKKYKLVVADFSSEHYGQDTLYLLYEKLDSSGLNFILLCHDIEDHCRYPRMLFYPHWYYHSMDRLIDAPDQLDRQYQLSCLNGNPRPHRIYNYLQLIKKPYYPKSLITAHSAENLSRLDDVALSKEMLTEWQTLSADLPDRDRTLVYGKARSLSHPAYSDSYLHLVTETTVVPKLFVTEKTWKPVAAGQLFLVHGSPGTIKYLRDQGVDVFDDIIDHKYYDNETDWQVRADRIHQLIDVLVTQNLAEIYIQTVERRAANKLNFFSSSFDTGYQEQILTCINTQN
jgi:hypothetical protein